MEEYVRRPTPTTMLQGTDGSRALPADLTRQGPALIIFASPTPEGHEVLAELPLWVRRLPKVHVAAVLHEGLSGDAGPRPDRLLIDPQERMRRALAPGDAPMAVLLRTDDLLPVGLVVGLARFAPSSMTSRATSRTCSPAHGSLSARQQRVGITARASRFRRCAKTACSTSTSSASRTNPAPPGNER